MKTVYYVLAAAIVLAAVFAAGYVVLGSMGRLYSHETLVTGSDITAEHRRIAGALTGISFPPSTKFDFFRRTEGLGDDSASFKVRVTTVDLDAILAQPPLAGESWRTDRRYVYDANWTGWSPGAASHFRSAQFQLPGLTVLSLLIDDSSDDTKVVYINWNEA